MITNMLQVPVGSIARFDLKQINNSYAQGWYV